MHVLIMNAVMFNVHVDIEWNLKQNIINYYINLIFGFVYIVVRGHNMDIIESLDDEGDAKVTFQEIGEMDVSVLEFSLNDNTKIRVYPDGIEKLRRLLKFIDQNGLLRR